MKTGALEELRDEVLSVFDYLFESRGFEIAHEEHGTRPLIIIEGAFRIKFIRDLGTVEVLIGGADAPLGYADIRNGERAWFPLWGVVAYVENKPKPTTNEIMELGRKVIKMGRREYLLLLSNSLRNAINEIEGLFAKKGKDDRLKRLEAYLFE